MLMGLNLQESQLKSIKNFESRLRNLERVANSYLVAVVDEVTDTAIEVMKVRPIKPPNPNKKEPRRRYVGGGMEEWVPTGTIFGNREPSTTESFGRRIYARGRSEVIGVVYNTRPRAEYIIGDVQARSNAHWNKLSDVVRALVGISNRAVPGIRTDVISMERVAALLTDEFRDLNMPSQQSIRIDQSLMNRLKG